MESRLATHPPRRILVLGANGFIGKQLMRHLAQNPEITVIAGLHQLPDEHTTNDFFTPTGERISQRLIDITDAQNLQHAIADIDAIVNCAGGSTRALAQAGKSLAEAAKSMRVIHLSSMAVYGNSRGEIDEIAPLDTALTATLDPYAAAKLSAENDLANCSNAIILRLGCVYGPGCRQWSEQIAALLRSHRLGDLGAFGDGYANLLYLPDLIAAIDASLTLPAQDDSSPQPRIYNLAEPTRPTWNDYFLAYARALGSVPIKRLTKRRIHIETRYLATPLKLIGQWLARFKFSNIKAPVPITPALLATFQHEIRLDARRAQHDLKLQWTPLKEGLAQTANTYTKPQSAA